MREDIYYPSGGKGNIHACRWITQGEVKGIVQIVHGIAEYALRYEPFARYLNSLGYAVVAEDHMGHGQSICEDTIQGYFHGGWYTAAGDVVQLMKATMKEFPGIPYVLFGHSMGSFLARTVLARYPDSGIAACVICGTAWQPKPVLVAGATAARIVCKLHDETVPSPGLHNMAFGSYNARIENKRTDFDWLTRNEEIVDRYIADPLCGFVASAGLLRDMMEGISYIQKPSTLAAMDKNIPILFTAGEADPVGNYGKGVRAAAKAFTEAGMRQVELLLYPDCRHEILNELNRQQVFEDLGRWITRQGV